MARWEHAAVPTLQTAMRQGNAAALDLALHWAAASGAEEESLNEGGGGQVALAVAAATGISMPPGPLAEGAPVFRGLSAAQFEYQPATRAWKRKP